MLRSFSILARKPPDKMVKERIYVPESLYNRGNWIVCSLGVSGILFWLLVPTPPESQIVPHTFSPATTLWLQAHLGTDGIIAWLASIYYNFPMMTNIAMFFIVSYFSPRGKKGRAGWVYGVAILLGGVVDSIVYLLYPVAPPIRVPEYLQQGVVQVRLGQLPWSDDLITLKYSALPSGHVFYSILGYLLCREEGFTRMGRFYQVNTAVFSFIILYLGEHYMIDIVGAFLLAISVFYATTRYLDTKYPIFHRKTGFTRKTINVPSNRMGQGETL